MQVRQLEPNDEDDVAIETDASDIILPATLSIGSNYSPLDSSKKEIRLLTYDWTRHRNRASDGDFCLCTFELDTCPDFMALSYTWDAKDYELRIRNEGSRAQFNVPISQTLALFFAEIHSTLGMVHKARDQERRHEPLQYYWIDQVCIDQDNQQERSQQVNIMGEIFSKAACVLAWLGWRQQPRLYSDDLREVQARNIFEHRIWTRSWIVQEMILAKELLFCSTVQSAQWDPQLPETFCDCEALKKLWDIYLRSYKIDTTYSISDISQNTGLPISAVNLINRITMLGARTWQLTLSEALCNYATQSCRLPVDNIYAYQGLVVIGSRIDTDYARSKTDLFAKTLRIITYEKKHDLITKNVADSIGSILIILSTKLGLPEQNTYDQISRLQDIPLAAKAHQSPSENAIETTQEPTPSATLVQTVTRNDFTLWKQIHAAIKKGLLKEELFGPRLIQLRARRLRNSSPLLWTEAQWSEWIQDHDDESFA